MRMRLSLVSRSIATALACSACAASGALPGSPDWLLELDSGVFITTVGNDTVAVEQFALQREVFEVDAVTRSPATVLRNTRMEWDQQGILRTYEAAERDVLGEEEFPRTTLAFTSRRDSVYWVRETGRQRQAFTRGAIAPLIVSAPPLLSTFAVPARIAAVRGDSSATLVTEDGAFRLRVSRRGSDWVDFSDANFGTVRVRLDESGRAQEIDARDSRLRSHARRAGLIDFAAIARAFAESDSTRRGR
jgi:hypothetical protein